VVRENGAVWFDAFNAGCHCAVAHALGPSKKVLLAMNQNVPMTSPQAVVSLYTLPKLSCPRKETVSGFQEISLISFFRAENMKRAFRSEYQE
jgi:hypothetical protein